MLKFLFKTLGKTLAKRHLYITNSLSYLHRKPEISLIRGDFVRIAALELAANEIISKKIQGSIAEVGVYKGDFAAVVNQLFPTRKMYLFDTFEGFDSRDVKKEQENNFSTGEQDFSGTSVDLVLGKMTTPENCIVKKGFFPETAAGVEDAFVFVSLDTDLYDPILAGLHFFYPKLIKGGYIFVHDYNNDSYKGAKRAVQEFCAETGVGFTPLPDMSGTAIITK